MANKQLCLKFSVTGKIRQKVSDLYFHCVLYQDWLQMKKETSGSGFSVAIRGCFVDSGNFPKKLYTTGFLFLSSDSSNML